ncbi:hypothetical protein BS50DRAFT_620830 [Corynespora cassiicola Philippines]|uniref:BTB domain-containing protein n=1 Tax=Corynespora cassiicola Philippines TaxID=1448308 RepID=A0A2T2NMD2_CORCC|nr:hypothetical protein BS50DRAFT_620830 [Corynespora cassiicola Philippines]
MGHSYSSSRRMPRLPRHKHIDEPQYGRRYQPAVPPVRICDWDPLEFETAMALNLHPTIRSSKYPRTLRNPHRTIIILDNIRAYSIHTVLLQKFSPRLPALLEPYYPHNVTEKGDEIYTATLPSTPRAWKMFTVWLYTINKIPPFDFTPVRLKTRHGHRFSNADVVEAFVLAGYLGAETWEKCLLRMLMWEVFHSLYYVPLQQQQQQQRRYHYRRPQPQCSYFWTMDELEALCECLRRPSGAKAFLRELLRWQREGYKRELDPFFWRVEHWFEPCGAEEGGNWGCFHGMGGKGWGGVWERMGMGVSPGTGVEETEGG